MGGEHAGIEVAVISSACAATTAAVAWTTLSDWSDKRDGLGASVTFDTVSSFLVATRPGGVADSGDWPNSRAVGAPLSTKPPS